MIPINQLRIGNLIVNPHGEIQPVFDLNDEGMRVHSKPTVMINADPIPLTPELLEKCGFKLEDKESDSRYLGYGYSLRFRQGQVKAIGGTDFHYPVYSLHQLQNILYWITGQELTYTP